MKFIKSSITISFYTALSRILGFVRDILIAGRLGTSLLTDILFIALKLPNLFRSIFAEGAFSNAFVPTLSQIITKEGNYKAISFTKQILSFFLLFLVLFTVILYINLESFLKIFAIGYKDNQYVMDQLLYYSKITLPYLFFISLVSFCGAILNSFEKFAAVALMPILYNISIICTLLLLTTIVEDSILAICVGVLIAGVLQLIFIYMALLKNKIFIFPILRFGANMKNVLLMGKRFALTLFSSSIIQLNSIIDTIIASSIISAISYLYYSERLIQLPVALIAIAISVSILPSLTKAYTKGDQKEISDLQNQSLKLALMFILPATVGLITITEPIVTTLYQFGSFTEESSYHVIRALRYYSFCLPAMVVGKIFANILFALGNHKVVGYITLSSVVLNIILSLILVQFFSYIGIILATVIVNYYSLILTIYMLKKRNNFLIKKQYFRGYMAKYVYAMIFMWLALDIAQLKIYKVFAVNKIGQIITTTIIISIGIIVYFLVLYLVRAINPLLVNKYLNRQNKSDLD